MLMVHSLFWLKLGNHQFLENLLDAGIDDIVRIGGGARSERVAEKNIRKSE